MLSSSKVRKTRNGRAVLDVLSPINATCTAAKIDLTGYLRYVFKHLPDFRENPKNYTPYAVVLHLEQEMKEGVVTQPKMPELSAEIHSTM